jgi:hypothetical protein
LAALKQRRAGSLFFFFFCCQRGRERLGERDWERETGRKGRGERDGERETAKVVKLVGYIYRKGKEG